MSRSPYRAEYGAVYHEDCGPSFVFTVSPTNIAVQVTNALNLAAQVAALNPEAGEIGAGMLANLVALARKC